MVEYRRNDQQIRDERSIDRDRLDSELRESGFELDASQIAQLWSFHKILRRENPTLNLTRIHNFGNMVRKHYVDSLLVPRLMQKSGVDFPRRLLDLGTGPGLPGIPLAIDQRHSHIILGEGRKRRVDYLIATIDELKLDNSSVYGRRIYRDSPIECDGVITRAVELIEATLTRVRPILPAGGLVIFMKGPHCDDEINEVAAKGSDQWQLALDQHYTLPHSDDERRLVIYRLLQPLPRRNIERRVETIQSPSNERYRSLLKLLQPRQIKKEGRAILSGRKIVAEFLAEREEEAELLVLPEAYRWHSEEEQELLSPLPCVELVAPLFAEIDSAQTRAPLLIVKTPQIEEWSLAAWLAIGKDVGNSESDGGNNEPTPADGVTLLLPLSDPENLGAALRSAAAFSVREVVLLEGAASPWHPRALRAAAGEAFHLQLLRGPSSERLSEDVAALQSSDELPLWILDTSGAELGTIQPAERLLLYVGPEGPGVPGSLQGQRVTIPISAEVESLNAGVATAIALYQLQRDASKLR